MHKVKQLHFIGWPDHGVPNIKEVFDIFLMMIQKVIEEKTNNSAPIVIHCSAGYIIYNF